MGSPSISSRSSTVAPTAEADSARKDLQALENGDPTTLLTAEEIERANARRALVLVDDVATLTQEELVNRLEAVIHGGDRASGFVSTCRPAAGALAKRRVLPELSQALEGLAEKLVPDSRKSEIEAARCRIREAEEAGGAAWLAERDQTSAYAPRYSVTGG